MNLGHWTFQNKNDADIPEGTIGFVYCIIDKKNGKKYIGKKLLRNKKKRKPLKGRVNSRRYTVDSDWKEYTGSSPILNDYMEKNEKNDFEFIILHFHSSKLLLAYYEIKELIDRNAIFSNEYYNEVLSCRFRNKK